ncbi:hypothetical protein RND71_014576 [Anisodus tanguticus]|uniref:Uncharacterized protein n=1 Tax=Anisodus tanguticus TaxID=243964 RepID=A0AAE1SD18_9SOLA|nr:hypothetical protein RND71_014576 [Anisodus tanguticus]
MATARSRGNTSFSSSGEVSQACSNFYESEDLSFEPVEVPALNKIPNISKFDYDSNNKDGEILTLVAHKRHKNQRDLKRQISKAKARTNYLQTWRSTKSNVKSWCNNASSQRVRKQDDEHCAIVLLHQILKDTPCREKDTSSLHFFTKSKKRLPTPKIKERVILPALSQNCEKRMSHMLLPSSREDEILHELSHQSRKKRLQMFSTSSQKWWMHQVLSPNGVL